MNIESSILLEFRKGMKTKGKKTEDGKKKEVKIIQNRMNGKKKIM